MQKNTLDIDLSGKVAVVTGAGGVLCSDMARALARAGARVALLNRTAAKAQVHADAINAAGGVARAYACNVVDAVSCQAAAAAVLADLGPCDILVNGAGGNDPQATTDKEYYEDGDLAAAGVRSFFDLSPEAVAGVFGLNFLGTILPTQAFVPQMLGRSGCCILNISSMNAHIPLTKIPAYSGAKAAVTNLTQWLAVHFSRQGIRVNAVAPGITETDMMRAVPKDVIEPLVAQIPLRRLGQPEDIANAFVFLASDLASYITGVTLSVDGMART